MLQKGRWFSLQKEKANIWYERWKRLLPPIKTCKICFKTIKIDDFCRFFDKNVCLCSHCQELLEPHFIHFKVGRYKALAVYEYDEYLKKLIYIYKGCFDYEMKEVFLNLFARELKIIYSDFVMIPIPSFEEDDKIRGFNHVKEAFAYLGLESVPILIKTAHYKQAEKNAKNRKDISKYLALNSKPDLSKKRILLVDDIYTTGSTMMSAINLVEKLRPKEIRVLVLAKTKDKTDNKTNTK